MRIYTRMENNNFQKQFLLRREFILTFLLYYAYYLPVKKNFGISLTRDNKSQNDEASRRCLQHYKMLYSYMC